MTPPMQLKIFIVYGEYLEWSILSEVQWEYSLKVTKICWNCTKPA